MGRVGLHEYRFFSGTTTQAALIETIEDGDGAFAALVFRGTAGRLSSWLPNLDMVACQWSTGGNVHRGFRNILMDLLGPIASALEDVTKPLYYAGHSLGGALATLAASLRSPTAVYTFGAPRVGDAAFAQALAGISVFNIFNPKDIVTELPPASRRTPFVHAGTIIRNMDVAPPIRASAFIPRQPRPIELHGPIAR